MTDKSKLVIEWTTLKADDVVRYFVRGYQGGPPEHWEWFYDPAKSAFILKLYWRVPEVTTENPAVSASPSGGD